MTSRINIVLCAALIATFVSNGFGIGFDTTFGSGGKFTTSFSDLGDPTSGANDIFIQSSGRIVVVGEHSHVGLTGRFAGIALAGLTSNGLLDFSFGTLGKVLLWEPPVHRFLISSVVQPDDSILLLCRFFESATSDRPAILKFTANGQPDQKFNADINLVANQTLPVAITSGSGGKIYVVVSSGNSQHYVLRLNANGSRDTTFGPDGVRSINLNRFSTQPRIRSFEELPDGKLLVVGTYSPPTSDGQTFVVRLNTDATLDRSFGMQGVVRLGIPFGSVDTFTIRVQTDGKILIGGTWTFLGSTTLLMRLTARGRLDGDFGNHGFAQTSFRDWNVITGIGVAPDGTIFVAGIAGEKVLPSNQRLFLVQYSSTGTIQGSIVTNFIGDREAGASDIRLQSDGKLLIAGFTQNNFDNFRQLAAARFNP